MPRSRNSSSGGQFNIIINGDTGSFHGNVDDDIVDYIGRSRRGGRNENIFFG